MSEIPKPIIDEFNSLFVFLIRCLGPEDLSGSLNNNMNSLGGDKITVVQFLQLLSTMNDKDNVKEILKRFLNFSCLNCVKDNQRNARDFNEAYFKKYISAEEARSSDKKSSGSITIQNNNAPVNVGDGTMHVHDTENCISIKCKEEKKQLVINAENSMKYKNELDKKEFEHQIEIMSKKIEDLEYELEKCNEFNKVLLENLHKRQIDADALHDQLQEKECQIRSSNITGIPDCSFSEYEEKRNKMEKEIEQLTKDKGEQENKLKVQVQNYDKKIQSLESDLQNCKMGNDDLQNQLKESLDERKTIGIDRGVESMSSEHM